MSEQQLFIPATFKAVTLEMPARWRSWKEEKMACGEDERGGLQVKQSTRFHLLFPGLQLCRTRRVGSPQVELQMHLGWNEGNGWADKPSNTKKAKIIKREFLLPARRCMRIRFFLIFPGTGRTDEGKWESIAPRKMKDAPLPRHWFPAPWGNGPNVVGSDLTHGTALIKTSEAHHSPFTY